MGKYECVAENTLGTEHSKPTPLYVKVRRVPPTFSRPPEPLNEVMLGANLTLTCVAVGSPMPFVKWRQGKYLLLSNQKRFILNFFFVIFTKIIGTQDITPEDNLPVGRNILQLMNVQQSANYTCVAASSLGIIEANAIVKVQCKYFISFTVVEKQSITF